jgi:hypothetical protein
MLEEEVVKETKQPEDLENLDEKFFTMEYKLHPSFYSSHKKTLTLFSAQKDFEEKIKPKNPPLHITNPTGNIQLGIKKELEEELNSEENDENSNSSTIGHQLILYTPPLVEEEDKKLMKYLQILFFLLIVIDVGISTFFYVEALSSDYLFQVQNVLRHILFVSHILINLFGCVCVRNQSSVALTLYIAGLLTLIMIRVISLENWFQLIDLGMMLTLLTLSYSIRKKLMYKLINVSNSQNVFSWALFQQ